RLAVVCVEAAELDVEDLASNTEAGASANDAGDGLERGGERIIRGQVGGGVEILRRVRNAGGTCRQHGRSEKRLRLDGAVDDNFVFFGEEVGLFGGEDGIECLGSG